MDSAQINPEPTSVLMYGMGSKNILDGLESLFNNNIFKGCIVVIMSVLLAFENQVHIFEKSVTFFSLLAITVALIFTELDSQPGITLLMVALTVISFNMNVMAKNSNKQ